MITNKHKLPDTFVKAVERHEHKGAFLTASQTNNSTRMFWLKKRHDKEIVEDVSDRIWSLMGTAVHYILDKSEGKNDLTEEYLEHELNGVKVSGTSDLYKDKTVIDYKTTSVWSIVYLDDDKMDDYARQLNTYAYLYRKAGFTVEKLQIVAILRDWKQPEAKRNPSYPQSQIKVIDIPLWSEELQESFLSRKIEKLMDHEKSGDNHLPLCTDKELWSTGDKWAVKKKGLKRALNCGVCDSEEKAQAFADSQDFPTEIEFRKGESKRCAYCDVREFCNQYKELNK